MSLHLDAVAWERAERYSNARTNLRIVCADGFSVSVQASPRHYSNDSHPDGEAPYWRDDDIDYPFTTFEIGYPSEPITDPRWSEYDASGGEGGPSIWAFVPRQLVADLIDSHGGSTGWQKQVSA